MTVCIAALCQNEDQAHIVVVADRMVTLGGFIEFEHAVPKMKEASSLAIAMVSGDALVGTRIAEEVATALAESNPPIAQIAAALAACYENARQKSVEQRILRPRCLDMNSFYGSHQALNPNIVMMLDNQMAEFNLGVELLLAGLDSSGAHIYSIVNPGPPESLLDGRDRPMEPPPGKARFLVTPLCVRGTAPAALSHGDGRTGGTKPRRER